MKYETPELTALAPAMNAIQTASSQPPKAALRVPDGAPTQSNEHVSSYVDWE